MKKYLILIIPLFFSCTPKESNIIKSNNENTSPIQKNTIDQREINNILTDVVWGEKEYYQIDSDKGLKIRKEPNINSETIGLFNNDTVVYLSNTNSDIVEIDGIKANWVYVSHNNQEGWVFGGYLKKIPKIDIDKYEYTDYKLSYGLLEPKDFSEDWKNFYIFSKDYIPPQQEMMLLRSKLSTEISYSDFKIVTGLFENNNGFCGPFIAKIDIHEENVLEINILDYKSKKLLFMYQWTQDNKQYISVGSAFESEFFFYLDKNNISKKLYWEEI